MSEKLISIIVPFKNESDFIQDLLTSIHQISCSNLSFEIFFVDDSSVDGTRAIIEDWASSHKSSFVINNEGNGVSDARNTPLNIVQGKYIYFCDADDIIIAEEFVAVTLELGGAKADIIEFDHRERAKNSDTIHGAGWPRNKLMFVDDYLQTSNRKRMPKTPIWRYFYSKRLFESGLSFRGSIVHEDILFTVEAFELAETYYYSDHCFYVYRHRFNSITTDSNNEHIDFRLTSLVVVIETLNQKLLPSSKLPKSNRKFVLQRYQTAIVSFFRICRDNKSLRHRQKEVLCMLLNRTPKKISLRILAALMVSRVIDTLKQNRK